jgi:hypothetical protein
VVIFDVPMFMDLTRIYTTLAVTLGMKFIVFYTVLHVDLSLSNGYPALSHYIISVTNEVLCFTSSNNKKNSLLFNGSFQTLDSGDSW